jgi:lipoprotein-anchoring transpeptidase ErfK/SrfK
MCSSNVFVCVRSFRVMSEVAAVARSRRVCLRAFSAACAASVAASVLALEARPAAALGYSAESPEAEAPKAPRKRAKRGTSSEAKPAENVSLARPLFAVVSLSGQHISIYNHNGLVDRSVVSTGVPGHSTPEGMFTILGRERFHRSNLYSGAPMPFMQRITWSGVAMHTGHVTGHPASHGCIRLPGGFAQKLWGMTRIGERVVIAPYDLSPTEISHPALPAPKMRSPTEASAATLADAGLRDGFADAGAAPLLNPRRYAEQLKTKSAADAAAASKAATEASVALNAKRQEAARASAELRSAEAAESSARAKAEAAAKAAETAAAKRQDVATAKPDLPTNDGASPAEAAKAKADAALAESKARLEAAKTAYNASDAEVVEAGRRSREAAEASAAAAKAEKDAQLRAAPISILVSKKNQRIYVRQGLTPIFEAPATIREPERPLGSHLYIATATGENGALKWSVLSMPPRIAEARAAHKKKGMVEERSAAPLGAASSAAEALDRLELSDDVRQQIADRLWLGGSIIISDQGPSSETGAVGTDLTVKFR